MKSLFLVFAIVFSLFVSAQNDDESLMTIGDEKISKSEFLNIYNKNNTREGVVDKKSLEEYLELFINFKLKVKEAEEQGLDTSKSFINELNGYRKQLAQPYLTDKEVNDNLIQEAYERMQYDIRASHILVLASPDASPEDTLKAFKKITKLRNRVINGEDFGLVAWDASEDIYSKDTIINGRQIKGNRGDLGYFSAFDMIYSFENGAYNTEIDQVSKPFRTRFGFHIIKVNKKVKALGKVHVAHIQIAISKNASGEDEGKAEKKAQEIYQKLKNGENFEDLVDQFSDDKGSAKKGGELPWFGVNRMVPEFIEALIKLEKNGDISEPVLTPYGWHIIKLLERKPIGSFVEVKGDIKQRVSKDARSVRSKEGFIKKIQKEYNFRENPNALLNFYSIVDTTIFQKAWTVEKAVALNDFLFTIGDNEYTQQDFAKYLVSHQLNRTKEDIKKYVNKMYKAYIDETCIAYEDSKLEEKYPEFKSLMKEYHDGILLFDITDKKVWSKAIKDTLGLEEFYQKNKTNYMWGERLDATIYSCTNEQVVHKTRKLQKKALKKSYTNKYILDKINEKSELNLKIESDKYSKGDNDIIDSIPWETGTTDNIKSGNSIVFVIVRKKLNPEPKLLEEAKGLITADYQNYLEKEWIKSLKQKYAVEVNEAVFSSIK